MGEGREEGMVEGREEGMVEGREEGMAVGKGEVGSGVAARELSEQCGMGVGMGQVVEVGVVVVRDGCGGRTHGRVIQ